MLRCLISSRSHSITASRPSATPSMICTSSATYASIGELRTSCSVSTICSTRSSTGRRAGAGRHASDHDAPHDGESSTGESSTGEADASGVAA